MPLTRLIVILGLFLVLSGCGSVSVNGLQNSADCTNVTSTFATDVVPIFGAAGCTASGCHTGGSAAGGLNLNDSDASVIYDNIIQAKAVDPKNDPRDPLNAPLLAKPFKGLTPHEGGDIFDDFEDDSVVHLFCWIKSGADDN